MPRGATLAVLIAVAGAPAAADPAAVLVDRFGRTVGPISMPGFVLIVADGQAVRVPFRGDGLPINPPHPEYFASADCSGERMLEAEPLPPIAYLGTTSQAPSLGYIAPGPARRVLTSGSTWIVTGMDHAPCAPLTVPVTAAPLVETPGAPGFTPPFSVQVR